MLAPEEKDALDEWYIRNAFFRLDMRILFMTLQCVFRGERLGEAAIAEAFAMRRRQCAAEAFEVHLFARPAANEVSISEPVESSPFPAVGQLPPGEVSR